MRFKSCFYMLVVGVLLALLVLPHSVFAQTGTQSFISPDGSLVFDYPDTWFAGEDMLNGGFYVSNSADFAEIAQGDNIPSGITGVLILPVDSGDLLGFSSYTSIDEAGAALESIITLEGDAETSYSPLEIITVGNYVAARISFFSPDFDGNYYLIEAESGLYVIALGVAAASELSQAVREIHESVLASSQVDASAILGSSSSNNEGTSLYSNNGLTFEYPNAFYEPYPYMGRYDGSLGDDTYNFIYASGDMSYTLFTPQGWSDSYALPATISANELAVIMANKSQDLYADELETVIYGPATEINVGPYPAVRVDFLIEGSREGFGLAFDVNGQLLAMKVTTALGELPERESLFLDMAASVTFDPSQFVMSGNPQGELAFDSPVSGSVANYEADIWSFNLEAGEAVEIKLAEETYDLGLQVYNKAGVRLMSDILFNSTLRLVADVSGTYYLRVVTYKSDSFDYSLISQNVPIAASVSAGNDASVVLSHAAPAFVTFEGVAGQIAVVTVSSDLFLPNIDIYGPGGSILPIGYGFGNTISYSEYLPFSGTYVLAAYLDEYFTEGEEVAFSVSLAEAGIEEISLGSSLEGTYVSDETLYYRFDAAAGDPVNITVTSDSFTPHIRLYMPGGIEFPLGDGYSEVSEVLVNLPLDGSYTLSVGTRFDFNEGPFTLSLTQ